MGKRTVGSPRRSILHMESIFGGLSEATGLFSKITPTSEWLMGTRLGFWKDKWIGTMSLEDIFRDLFVIALDQHKSVAEMWTQQRWDLRFRRMLNDWEIPRLTELFKQLENCFQGLQEGAYCLWWSGHYYISTMEDFINLRGIAWTMPNKIGDTLFSWEEAGAGAGNKERWRIIPSYFVAVLKKEKSSNSDSDDASSTWFSNYEEIFSQLSSVLRRLNEEMMDSLFGYIPGDQGKDDRIKVSSSFDQTSQYIQIIDPKKSQNLAILLKALNVTTEELYDALDEGKSLSLPMVAEEVSSIKESFATLEVASKELRNSRLFLKLLEAVLNTGNSMNDGAQAFKLDTFETLRSHRLKENQSTTSVQTEDFVEDNAQESADYHRNLGLQVVSGLSNELENVRKASLIDGKNLSSAVMKLS
ncbi:hypothetical protein MTR67_032469 [Solanum verrucosum]|uniref:FH2 domain-containing protein n=1 Tax=Solanum verrucosum TaxID=315347 RepID=A0AAF0U4H9_SOLVR|nr:hypothetical protein MTR67_032469 [Solanum verrucosum]